MSFDKPKVTIVGIGGVGGVVAGPITKYSGEDVTYIARGKRKDHIIENGLTIHSDLYGEMNVKPGKVAENGEGCEIQDLILVCVKNDAIAAVAKQIAPMVGENTAVIGVMNGVNVGKKLRAELGKGRILESVIYTVSSSEADFSIIQKGKFTQIFAGFNRNHPEDREIAEAACAYMVKCGIDCRFSDHVDSAIWKKYILNCAYNVVTARWGITIGDIKKSEELRADYRALMEEAYSVAVALGVSLKPDTVDSHMERLDKTTDDSTSSLSRDFDKGIVGEMELFSKELLDMAAEVKIECPKMEAYYAGMVERASKF